VRHPDKATVVGQLVTIQCHSNNSNPVSWWYHRDDMRITHLVINGELASGNSERFSLNTSNYDLTLMFAKWNDSGFYMCIEDTGFGTHHKTYLTVTGIKL